MPASDRVNTRAPEPSLSARRGRCIWLDGPLLKACRVLRARLGPLGYRVVCRANLPDPLIAELAAKTGCALATTDEYLAALARRLGARAALIDAGRAARKSARDLATLILRSLAQA